MDEILLYEDDDVLLEEDDKYVHKVTEQYHEGDGEEAEGPMPLRTKSEAEELGEGDAVEEEEESGGEFEEEGSFEEEDI